MLARVDVKFASRGKWQWSGTRDPQLWQRVGDYARKSLHDRIAKQGRDGEGTKIPPLKRRATYWTPLTAAEIAANKASRQASKREAGEKRVQTRAPAAPGGGKIGRIKVDGKWIAVRFRSGGYPEEKKRVGKRPVRDLDYTGSLWDSLTPQMRLSSMGVDLRLYFAGSDRRQKVETTKDGKTSKRAVRQRDKAAWVQYEGQGRTGKRMYELMTHTPEEIARMGDMILAAIRLRG